MPYSLGFITDVAMRRMEGATVTRRDGYQVISTAANPRFWWGNFILLDAPPAPGSSGAWLDRFAAEFPAAEHVALGIDTTDMDAPVPDEFAAAGFSDDRSVVLTATEAADPPHPSVGVQVRPLSSDADWRQAAELSMRITEEEGGTPDPVFHAARASARRELAGRGHGTWFGAFDDGHLLGQLGLFRVGDGYARYQDVATAASARRRGIAGTLVCHAARYGLDTLAVKRLVIIAEQDGPAIAVYRACGFTDTEGQVSLSRPPE
ncbi:MAG TPA: GNAT family N-acetyltransferase [Streptosporangiaceae bacterium]|nr:GNAT family N-acetyltransferase [Streptosporangiaceae bacterium]